MLQTFLSRRASTAATAPALVLAASLAGCSSHDDRPLPPPVAITVTSGASNVTASWPAVEGARSYAVHRCPVPAGATNDPCRGVADSSCGHPVAAVTGTSYVDAAPPGVPACYKVRACSSAWGTLCGVGSVAQVASVFRPIALAATVAASDQVAYAGQTVTLSGGASGASGSVTFQWKQIGGTKVTLQDDTSATARFVAPAVSGGSHELLSFELLVSDAQGAGRTGKTSVTVQPAGNVTISAIKQRHVQALDSVSLHASGSGATAPAYQWTQVSPAAPRLALAGATTANAQFKAPNVDGVSFVLRATYTDTATGRFASADTTVTVTRPPVQASAQPLTLPTVSPTIAPQPLRLLAVPESTANAGASHSLALGVTGGTPPYRWSWAQTSGPQATLAGTTQPVLAFTAPAVTSPQHLGFVATVTDGTGASRQGAAVVRVLPPPPTVPPPNVPVLENRPPLQAVASLPVPIVTKLKNPVVVQTTGPQLAIGTPTTSGPATTVTVTAPPAATQAATATVTITGTSPTTGQTVQQIQPVLILTPPPRIVVTAPPSVSVPVPHRNPVLSVSSVGIDRASEGQPGVVIGVNAQGGSGSYTYRWTYDQQPGQPAVNLAEATTSHPSFTAPGVSGKTILRFTATVTDGGQTASTPVYVVIDDLAATLVVGTLADISANSGDFVSLHAPGASGGVPPYAYGVVQTAGPSVGTLSGANPSFPLPALAPGAPDATLSFEYTVTDGYGNQAKAAQNLLVKAPPAPVVLQPLAASFGGPGGADVGTQMTLNTNVNGGVPPYSYEFTVTSPSGIPAGQAGTTDGMAVPNVANPSFSTPVGTFARVGIWTFTMKVTDSATPPAVVTPPPFRMTIGRGAQCMVCGDPDNGIPCNDMELVIGDVAQCELSQPFCLNNVLPRADGSGVDQYRRCADFGTVAQKWWAETASEPACPRDLQPDAVTKECNFACVTDGCNIDMVPSERLIVDPNGSANPVSW